MHKTRVQSLGGEDPLEEVMDNPLQYSCLENPTDRGTWQAAVHRVAKSQDIHACNSLISHSKEVSQRKEMLVVHNR